MAAFSFNLTVKPLWVCNSRDFFVWVLFLGPCYQCLWFVWTAFPTKQLAVLMVNTCSVFVYSVWWEWKMFHFLSSNLSHSWPSFIHCLAQKCDVKAITDWDNYFTRMSKIRWDLSIFFSKCINTPTCQTEVRKDSLPRLFVKHSLPTGDWQAYLYAGLLLQITGVETCFVSGLTEGESARKSLFGLSSGAFNWLLCCVCMGEEKLNPPFPSVHTVRSLHRK